VDPAPAGSPTTKPNALGEITNHHVSYSIDGLQPAAVCPSDLQGLSDALSEAAKDGLAVAPWGGGTRVAIGNRPARLDRVLDLSCVRGIVHHNPADLTATVGAGIPVAELQRHLAEQGQFLAIDPPLPDRATVGGTLAVGGGGPTKWHFGHPRDLVIGMKVVQADGSVVSSGGQVVKNVSGYDMARLHVGGLGTLGVIAEVSFKLTPLPQGEATLVAAFDSASRCLGAGLTVFHSGVTPLALAAYDAEVDDRVNVAPLKGHHLLAVRLGGRPLTLQRALRECRSLCHLLGATAVEALDESGAVAAWRKLADFGWDEATAPLMSARASVPPTKLAETVEAIANGDAAAALRCATLCHVGYGTALIHWFADGPEPPAHAIAEVAARARKAVHAVGGRMNIERCPLPVKAGLDVWDQVGEPIAIMRRLKEQYDPGNVLNPGRFVGGI
jgi:glycolate oxidase FAD binding subunit